MNKKQVEESVKEKCGTMPFKNASVTSSTKRPIYLILIIQCFGVWTLFYW
jgi:hypothetical protein